MKRIRMGVAVLAGVALIPLTATAAFSAPPANDTPDGAVALTLGQTYNEDTSKATTDSQDADLNQVCGAPFTNASVWFTYDAGTNGTILVDMSQSDYTGGFMIFDGAPTQDSMIDCGPTSLVVDVASGHTYTIVAFSDTTVNGGNLVLSLTKGPPPPKVKVTLDDAGWAFKDGSAQLSGTYLCKRADFLDLQGQMTQIWRRVKITGFFFKEAPGSKCDGRLHSWKATVVSDNGLYAAGTATVDMFNFACGALTCTEVDLSKTVTLHNSTLAHAPKGTVGKAASAHRSLWAMHSAK